MYLKLSGKHTVEDIVRVYGRDARTEWSRRFETQGVEYPPTSVTFVALKRERMLEVWVPRGDGNVRVAEYPILAASGGQGPKLHDGDRQVPEGIYGIEGLNPNSSYHLSMKVSYPNAFDHERATADGRTDLGGDIFIHGKSVSIGCLAMGDSAIEELFVLAADAGRENVRVIIAPLDLRKENAAIDEKQPPWLQGLYGELATELVKYRVRSD